jgi:hypothetical protein
MSGASILNDRLGCRAYPGSMVVSCGSCSCTINQPSEIRCTHATMEFGDQGSKRMRRTPGVVGASTLRKLVAEGVATSQALAGARVGKCCAAKDRRCKNALDSLEKWGIGNFLDVAHRPGGSKGMSQERSASGSRGMEGLMRSAGCCAGNSGLEASRDLFARGYWTRVCIATYLVVGPAGEVRRREIPAHYGGCRWTLCGCGVSVTLWQPIACSTGASLGMGSGWSDKCCARRCAGRGSGNRMLRWAASDRPAYAACQVLGLARL